MRIKSVIADRHPFDRMVSGTHARSFPVRSPKVGQLPEYERHAQCRTRDVSWGHPTNPEKSTDMNGGK